MRREEAVSRLCGPANSHLRGPARCDGEHRCVRVGNYARPREPFDDRAAEEYGKVRAHLAALGTPIGPNDLMIAAIALANQMTLVTHNTADYQNIPGLRLDDWLTP